MSQCNPGCGCSSNHAEKSIPSTLPDIYVDGVILNKEELAQELQYHPAPTFQEAVQQAAQALILRTLLLKEARVHSLDLEDEEGAFRTLLNHNCHAKEVSEEDSRRYYEMNPERFTTAPHMIVRHILLSAKKNDLDWRSVQKKLASNLIQRLKSADNFEAEFQALLTYSKCPSKDSGGSLGVLHTGETVPEFERQVYALNEGLASEPIETRFGYHIIWVEKKVPGEPVPFEVAEVKIKSYLTERAHRQAVAEYLVKLVSKANIRGIKIQLNDDNIVLPH